MSRRKLVAIIGALATAIAITGGLLNMYNWWNIDWEAISYNQIIKVTPYFGIFSWMLTIIIYKIRRIKSPALWAIAMFWLFYNIIHFLVVYGWLR